MNYGVGDTVVCIDATPGALSDITQLHVGATYKVLGVRQSPCCNRLEVDVGIVSATGHTRCFFCNKVKKGAWKSAWRFIKLDGLLNEQEERHEQKLEA